MQSGPQFSPDGSKIAFESSRSGAMKVWVCGRDGSSLMQLTHFGPSQAGTPRWSPDGQQIVFDARPAGSVDLYVIDSQGGPLRRLTRSLRTKTCQVGRETAVGYITHQIGLAVGTSGKCLRQGSGSPVQVTHHGGFAAFESPDGKFLYYAKGLTVAGLWRIPTNGGEEVEIIGSLEAGYWGYWAVVDNGIYHLDTTREPKMAFFDITTHSDTQVFRSGKPSCHGSGGIGRLSGQRDNPLHTIRRVK